jgi:hypothetical protein
VPERNFKIDFVISNEGQIKMADDNVCAMRTVAAPDGTDIPIPVGGVGTNEGMIEIRDDAQVQISPKADTGYYVVVNNADPSNDEAAGLFSELTVEGAITTLENLAKAAFSEAPELLFKGAGLLAGVLVSLFTTSKLTREVFIRASLPDSGTPVTYCLLT